MTELLNLEICEQWKLFATKIISPLYMPLDLQILKDFLLSSIDFASHILSFENLPIESKKMENFFLPKFISIIFCFQRKKDPMTYSFGSSLEGYFMDHRAWLRESRMGSSIQKKLDRRLLIKEENVIILWQVYSLFPQIISQEISLIKWLLFLDRVQYHFEPFSTLNKTSQIKK